MAKPEAITLVGLVIRTRREVGNNVKALEAGLSIYPLCFQAVVGSSGAQIFVLFGAAAGPINDQSIDFIARAEAKCYGQF